MDHKIDAETVRQIAMALPGTSEHDHFGMPAFRVNNKIFSTLRTRENLAMVALSPVDQSVFCAFDGSVFYPVPNKWGLKGATFVNLDKVRRDMLADALHTAWATANAAKRKK